jgi:RecA-family ATPase
MSDDEPFSSEKYQPGAEASAKPGNGVDPDPEPLLKLVPIRFVKGQPVPERKWRVPGWIPDGEVTLFQGDGGLGKSTIAQQLQTSCAVEKPWLGQFVEPCSSVGFYTESKQCDLEIVQDAINRAYGTDHDMTTAMALFPRRGEDNELVVFDRSGNMTLRPFYYQVYEAAQDYHAGLVVLDVAVDLYGGDEIKRRQVRAFVRTLNNLADKIAGSVMLTGHVSQAGLQSDGGHSASTDWSNAVRSRLYLGEPKDKDDGPDATARIVTRKKANFAGIGDTIKLHWRNGVFMPDTPTSSSLFRQTVDETFLALLDAMTAEGQKVSPKPRASNYAPAFFMKRPKGDRGDYERATLSAPCKPCLRAARSRSSPMGRRLTATKRSFGLTARNSPHESLLGSRGYL